MNYDEEQIRDIYAHYSLAMYFAQVFEHSIVNALVILCLPERHKYTRQDIDKFMEGKFEKTLGALLKCLKLESELALITPQDFECVTTEALKRRNYLAHHYFREKAESFVTRSGRVQMLEELRADQQLFKNADEKVRKILTPFRIKYGITDSMHESEYRHMCQQLGIAT
jgi:hypothetical protein